MQTNLSPMYRCADGNLIQFYEAAVPNEARTLSEGRSVNYLALMARITSPGMKNQVHHQEIHLKDESGKVIRRKMSNTTRDKKRVYYDEIYREQLNAFKEGREGTDALGTPLEAFPKIDVAIAATLRSNGVHTLEAFAAVPDAQLPALGPQARTMRDSVKQYLESMTGNSTLREMNDQLAKRIAELEARMSSKPAEEAPKRRGRKPKALTQDGADAAAQAA